MADTPDGIDLIRSRMQRGRRTPPTARGSRPPVSPASTLAAPVAKDEITGTPPQPPAPARRTRATVPQTPRAQITANAPTANLALRVRRPLDDHLADLVHEFRREGVRTSKVELVELLLWELPNSHAELRSRLAQFRQAASRSGGELTP